MEINSMSSKTILILNDLLNKDYQLNISFNPHHLQFFFNNIQSSKNHIIRWISIQSHTNSRLTPGLITHQASLEYLIYGLIYIFEFNDNRKRIKDYYRSIIFLYSNNNVSLNHLIIITKILLYLYKKVSSNSFLLDIVIKAITAEKYQSLPHELFKIFIEEITKDSYDLLGNQLYGYNRKNLFYSNLYHNKKLLLLLSINDKKTKELIFSFLIKVFKYHYDLNVISFIVNKTIKANFWFKYNSIDFIQQLINEEEVSRQTPIFFIKKGFVINNSNHLIVSPLSIPSNEFTIIFAFRFDYPSNGNPNDKSIIFSMIQHKEDIIKDSQQFEMQIYIEKGILHISNTANKTWNTQISIELFKDYKIIFIQKKGFESILYVNDCKKTHFLKPLKFNKKEEYQMSFGHNFNGIIGTFILLKSLIEDNDKDFFKHIQNLYEDYDLIFNATKDLSLIKPYCNHWIRNTEGYCNAFEFFKMKQMKNDFVLIPPSANRFFIHHAYQIDNTKIKIRHARYKTQFDIQSFNDYTIFQFLKYDGLNYIALLFGLLPSESIDTVQINMFINIAVMFLFKLREALGENNLTNEINVVFTVIFNYIIANDSVKINLPLFMNLFGKINDLNMSEETVLRGCILKILINKKNYNDDIKDNECQLLFNSIKTSITAKHTGILKKYIVHQLLSFTYFIGKDNIQKFYMNLLKQLAIISVENNKAKIFDPFISYLISTYNLKDIVRFKLLKIIYLYLGKTHIISCNNELSIFLFKYIKSVKYFYTKWDKLSYCLSYLILINNIDKDNEERKLMNKSVYYLAKHYPAMNNPSIEFFRTIIVEMFKDTSSNIKLKYIKGKASFKDFILPKNINDIKKKVQLKLLIVIKYIKNILNNSNRDSKTNKDIILTFNVFIQQMLEVIQATNKDKKDNLHKIMKCIFESKSFVYYFIYLFDRDSCEPEKLLSQIINVTISLYSKPFYFQFIYEYFARYIKREDDLEIKLILDTITTGLKKQNGNVISNNRINYLFLLYKIIDLGRNKLCQAIKENSLDFIKLLQTDVNIIQSKEQYKISNDTAENKSCLEIIFDILIILYNHSDYSPKYREFLKNMIRSKNNKDDTLFYIIDTNKQMPKYDPKTKQNIEYSFCIIFLLKQLKILHKEDHDSFAFLKDITKMTLNDAKKLYRNMPTKKLLHSSYINNKDYYFLVDLIERKINNSDFDCIKNEFDMHYQSKQQVRNKVIQAKNINLHNYSHTSFQNKQIKLISSIDLSESKDYSISSQIYKKDFEDYLSKTDLNITSLSLKTRKRSLSQDFPYRQKLSYYSYDQEKYNSIYFIDKKERNSVKFLFNLKHNLIWNIFPFLLKKYIFTNKTFIAMKKCYLTLSPDLLEKNVLSEYNYPVRIKNYTCKGFYKPILKPDLSFYVNPLYSISHPYYEKPQDDILSKFSFNKIIPKTKRKHSFFNSYCELVTNHGCILGKVSLYSYFIIFTAATKEEDIRFDDTIPIEQKKLFMYGSDIHDVIESFNKKILFYLEDIEEILLRRYLFQWIAFEFFLSNRQSYYINFFTEELKDQFLEKIIERYPHSKITITTDPINTFKREDYTKQWIDNKLSTFNYLLLINKYSSRTYNDTYQYPIFPWIHYNMKGNKRDFNNVICNQTDKRREAAMEQYQRNNHFNFHYSSSGHILYYLVRSNPITYAHIRFQNYQFDMTARLFHCLYDTLKIFALYTETREIIPEFFYDLNFLINLNKNAFGVIKDRDLFVNDVTCYKDQTNVQYIFEQRNQLEQAEDIGIWLNNIFGINQMKSSLKSNFCFKKGTYEKHNNYKEKIKKWKEKGENDQVIYKKIRNKISLLAFGMTPVQLFHKDHLKRNTSLHQIRQEYDYDSIVYYLAKVKGDKYRLGVLNDDLIYFKYLNHLDLFTVNNKEKSILRLQTISFPKQGHLRYRIDSFCKLSEELYGFCRFFDNTIKIYNIEGNNNIAIQCYSFITCLCAISDTQFVAGDEFGIISKWVEQGNHAIKYYIMGKKVIGHQCEVLKIIHEPRLDVIISIDAQNICVIHNTETLDLLTIIEVNQKIIDVKISFQDILIFLCQNNNKTNDQEFLTYSINGLLLAKSTLVTKPKISSYILTNISGEIIIAQGNQIYKTNILNYDLRIREVNEASLLYASNNKEIKQMEHSSSMKKIIVIFIDNTITMKNFD